MSVPKAVKIVVGGVVAAGAVGAAYLLYKMIKDEYSFVSEQDVDLSLLPAPMLEEIFESDDSSYREKLDRAKDLVKNGTEKFSHDFAAFLAFAALEEFLRNMISGLGLTIRKKLTGIVDACIRLRSGSGSPIITEADYLTLKYVTQNIRNPLVHGQIYKKDEVPAAIEFIDYFIDRYEPIAA